MRPLTFRWILLGVSSLLAIALLVRGNVVIGGIIAVMVVVRIGMLTTMTRRRREFAQRFPGRVPARARRNPD